MRWESHNKDSLVAIQATLNVFHQHKDAFIDLGLCLDFNFLKLHAVQHNMDSIRLFGSADRYNTEIGERLNIQFAKMGYWASNCWKYIAQMTCWLACCEKMNFYLMYQDWLDESAQAHGSSLGNDDTSAAPKQHLEDSKLLGICVEGPHGFVTAGDLATGKFTVVHITCM
jgi:hypothetical protein